MGSSQSSMHAPDAASISSDVSISRCSLSPPGSKIYYDSKGDGWYRLKNGGYIQSKTGDDLRVSFDTTLGASVKGFPSKGGVYERRCSPMELDFLNLSRFDTVPPSPDPAEEDAFCARLQTLGAEWWTSIAAKYEYESSKEPPFDGFYYKPGDIEKPVRDEKKLHYSAVTSEGGIWALAIDKQEGKKKGVGRIENAVNMEEKCKEIEKFGGVFFPDPRDCPLLDFRGIEGLSTSDDELDRLERTMRREELIKASAPLTETGLLRQAS